MIDHRITLAPNHEPSAWMRSQVAAAVLRYETGEYVECRHTETLPFALVDASNPFTRLCPDCLAAAEFAPTGCDQCGEAGPLNAWGARDCNTYLVVVLCTPCLEAEGVPVE